MSAAFVAANPVITPIADQAVNEGSLLRIAIASTAPSTAPSTFGICQITVGDSCLATAVSEIVIGPTKVNFSKLSDTTAEFNWTPNFVQSGTYRFNVSVSDVDSMTNDTFTATVNNVPPQLLLPASFNFGSDTQSRSNPNHETEGRQEINVSATLTITNVGEPVSGITGSVSAASGFSSSDVMVNFTLPKTSLATGESMSFPVSVRVPQKLDAVNSALSPVAVTVGTLTFSATPTISGATPITGSTQLGIRAENNLRIKSVKVRFQGKSESVDNGDTVNDMKPGDEVQFDIQTENRFSSREDVTIEDIEVGVLSESEVDIDESEAAGDLAAEETDTITFTTEIDSNADDGTFDVEITADGTDEFGARHGEKWVISFEVKRKSHEIEVTRLTLDPQTVSCEKQTSLTVDFKNSGRRDEDAVFVRVASPDLNFGTVSEKLSLDRDDEDSLVFNIPLPSNLAVPGSFRVTVSTYYNTDTLSNTDGVILSAQACKPVVEEKPPVGEKPPVVVTPVTPTNVTVVTPPAAKKSFFETPQYLALLILGYVIVIGGGATLIIKLLRK